MPAATPAASADDGGAPWTDTPWTGAPPRTGEPATVTVDVGGRDHPVRVWRHAAPTAGSPDGSPARRLLLIHGFRGDHHGMALLADALADHEVLVPDLPGFGETAPISGARHDLETYAAVVEGLAAALGLGAEDVLAGHSFGSLVVAAHAARTSRSWASLVLICPISDDIFTGSLLPGALSVEAFYAAARAVPEPAALRLLRSRPIIELTNLTMLTSRDARIAAYVRDQHRRHFSGFSDRRTVDEAYRASSRHTVGEFADQLDLPVLLIGAARDQLSTAEGRWRLREALPQARLEVLRGVGHLVHYEKPAPAARAIGRFLADLDAGVF